MAMWNVILLYITKYPDLKVTTTKPVKEKIKYLNEQIQAQLPDAGQSSTKRPGEGSLSPRRSKSPPATQNPMALLTVSLEDRRLYLNRYAVVVLYTGSLKLNPGVSLSVFYL